MQKTSNYQLNQWEASDKLNRADFNADNAAIDAAIKAVENAVGNKAEKSAVTAVENALANYKTSNDAAVASAAAKANAAYSASNLPIEFVTIDTTGKANEETVYTFEKAPRFVILQGTVDTALLAPGQTVTMCDYRSYSANDEATFTLSAEHLILTHRYATDAFQNLFAAVFW